MSVKTLASEFATYIAELPLVAILRGVTPDEVIGIGEAVRSAGFQVIEVPLNSPDPYSSIRMLAQTVGKEVLVGAGTVLTVEEVRAVADVGGRVIISPNTNVAVIRETKRLGLVSVPGFCTPTEALAAADAGADALKIFPASSLGPEGFKVIAAVMPDLPVLAVGGIAPAAMPEYLDAGISGFGLGSGLYRAGMDCAQVYENAERYVGIYREYVRSVK
ncbi:2-dehydro-3-deoxy-6-phosphogalactonate aldolase [Microbulbifer thermotolerans]|uniref:2-dehydro-3-deoxy-6-phosphogalactonate aldolase n=1 Tax=Microbulbifer thermotolerans TaxID=252514 RepID=UPI002248E79C|nr:2-dehydro-3-deoxy-6-phosphogalactonate aldolase [Microbulbifer thermotolerans]MCX2784078.1 2-dehydro-3-deoxy-6-phosphogalactonate aldolase [Microbulbifer thermotolerans]MCX2835802.1 2-dehydro-3-deoxy-6-phosphogalactonate aldolase [Microbulbifer thermotolerans]